MGCVDLLVCSTPKRSCRRGRLHLGREAGGQQRLPSLQQQVAHVQGILLQQQATAAAQPPRCCACAPRTAPPLSAHQALQKMYTAVHVTR